MHFCYCFHKLVRTGFHCTDTIEFLHTLIPPSINIDILFKQVSLNIDRWGCNQKHLVDAHSLFAPLVLGQFEACSAGQCKLFTFKTIQNSSNMLTETDVFRRKEIFIIFYPISLQTLYCLRYYYENRLLYKFHFRLKNSNKLI